MTFDKVKDIIVETLCCEEDAVTPEATLFEDLGADSLDVVELMMTLEDEYEVTLPEGEVEGIKTVQDIVDMLSKIEK